MNSTTAHCVELPVPSVQRAGRLKRWFILSAAAILLVTGGAKIITASGSANALQVQDPLLGVSFRHLLFSVGFAELAISYVCLFSKKGWLALGLVAWMATNFTVYRAGLQYIGWHRPCNCMGSLADALHVSPVMADSIMKVVLVYLLVGSYTTLLLRRLSTRKTL